jgi:hypothetical protein
VGRKVGRTIYLDDELVGVMDTPALAQGVVDALTDQAWRREARYREALSEIESGRWLASDADIGRIRAIAREALRRSVEP